MAEERAAEEPVPSSITVAATTTDRVLPALAAGAVFATIVLELTIDLAVARLRRKESLKTWAQRMGVSVTTLQRLEAGDPGGGHWHCGHSAVAHSARWRVGAVGRARARPGGHRVGHSPSSGTWARTCSGGCAVAQHGPQAKCQTGQNNAAQWLVPTHR